MISTADESDLEAGDEYRLSFREIDMESKKSRRRRWPGLLVRPGSRRSDDAAASGTSKRQIEAITTLIVFRSIFYQSRL